MTRFRPILACIVLAAAAWPALAAPALHSIDAVQVAGAIGKIGIQIAPSQITLLTNVETSTPSPVLQVRSVERFDAGRFIVRLECESQDNCLPFMASVHVNEDMAKRLSSATSRLSLLKEPFIASAAQPTPSPVVIRGGARATLLLDGAHIHIRIPVICLQSGSTGQTIRATTTDHRQVYTAQVVDVGVLRGRL